MELVVKLQEGDKYDFLTGTKTVLGYVQFSYIYILKVLVLNLETNVLL